VKVTSLGRTDLGIASLKSDTKQDSENISLGGAEELFGNRLSIGDWIGKGTSLAGGKERKAPVPDGGTLWSQHLADEARVRDLNEPNGKP
jgi:hypothetical protein